MEATEKNLPFAITLDVGSSLANKTGSWRTERAQYVDRLPPCNHACPAGENCQAWLYEAEDGGEGYERAWHKIVEDNPFPAIMGRVCYHPCETSCNRGELDEAVGIHSVERFIGDEAIKQGWSFDPPAESSGKRVLVVGAGPSGLSAAYHLRRLGHEVTIFEAGPMAGGMMRFGIPAYRLPRDVLDAEVDRILAMGVELELNRKVTNIEEAMTEGGFDAAFLAVGAHIGKHADIPAGEAARILDAVSMLESMECDERPLLGRRVVVYGGGNTAMDAARTAKRLGATDAVVVYRRNRDRMPAHEFEVAEAEEEGVMMRWLETIKQVDGAQHHGREDGARRDGLPAADRRARRARGRFGDPRAGPGGGPLAARRRLRHRGRGRRRPGRAEHDDRARGRLRGRRHGPGRADRDRRRRPWKEGRAQHRRLAARVRHTSQGPSTRSSPSTSSTPGTTPTHRKSLQPELEIARRRSTFDEVVGGLDESNAMYEARRCMSCGNCFSCDNCFGVCPDNAVMKLAETAENPNVNGYAIDLDFCKGCGLCVQECPCGAIEMIPEKI